MTDCPNAEIRDRLPDLLHDRLDASARAAAEAHVAGCADCRAELELLRNIQSSLTARTPRVNVSAIVAALPAPPTRSAAGAVIPLASRRRQMWFDWRVAASIGVLAVGAGLGSYELVRRSNSTEGAIPPAAVAVTPTPVPVSAPVTPTPESTTPSSKQQQPTTSPAPANPAAVVVADVDPAESGDNAQLGNLNQRQLQALISDIDQMQALPLTDAEPVTIKVDVKAASSSPQGAWQL